MGKKRSSGEMNAARNVSYSIVYLGMRLFVHMREPRQHEGIRRNEIRGEFIRWLGTGQGCKQTGHMIV
jgi:hypothetical protein